MVKAKRCVVAFTVGVFLFGFMSEHALIILEAKALYTQELERAEQIAQTFIRDEYGVYHVDLKKMKDFNLLYMKTELQRVVEQANVMQPEPPQIENMMVITIGVGALITALLQAGLTALVGLILEVGIFSACKLKAFDIYLRWTRTHGTAEYLFFNFCAAMGWF